MFYAILSPNDLTRSGLHLLARLWGWIGLVMMIGRSLFDGRTCSVSLDMSVNEVQIKLGLP